MGSHAGRSLHAFLLRSALVAASLVACSASSAPAPASADAGAEASSDPFSNCARDPGITFPSDRSVPAGTAGGDPLGGADKFTLAMALAGFPAGDGVLTARISTEQGAIVCTLDDANAPTSVANFIGLARGNRPHADPFNGAWSVGRFYDGLLFHRVAPGFVIQGGDPTGTGSGGPGYNMVVENQVAEPIGTLAMAAATAPNGSQFYISIAPAWPGKTIYNVFGRCDLPVAQAIGALPAYPSERPKAPIHMLSIEIARCPKR